MTSNRGHLVVQSYYYGGTALDQMVNIAEKMVILINLLLTHYIFIYFFLLLKKKVQTRHNKT